MTGYYETFTPVLSIVTKWMQVFIFTLSSIYHDISGRMMDVRDFVDLIMGNREVSSPVIWAKHSSPCFDPLIKYIIRDNGQNLQSV